jgi:hypothetical protein
LKKIPVATAKKAIAALVVPGYVKIPVGQLVLQPWPYLSQAASQVV